ncbi:MAG: hypothetical protein EDX89_00210 [Acidobacteria bacterium]|nr:MAG: hypothetical protein EDX89_00210 [Acidobacteriota bacterium]MCE7957590.1 hypothetical protein [Acidobacteria bacterium ACB2]
MKPTRLLAPALLLAALPGLATLDNQRAFKEYAGKLAPESAVLLGKCTTCHVKPLPKKDDAAHNPYGKALAATISAKPGSTPDFKAVEPLDSDEDGATNLEEIRKGTNPGDPRSK